MALDWRILRVWHCFAPVMAAKWAESTVLARITVVSL